MTLLLRKLTKNSVQIYKI